MRELIGPIEDMQDQTFDHELGRLLGASVLTGQYRAAAAYVLGRLHGKPGVGQGFETGAVWALREVAEGMLERDVVKRDAG